MEEFIVELPDEEDKTCVLEQFMQSLDFVNENEEFKLTIRWRKSSYSYKYTILYITCKTNTILYTR